MSDISYLFDENLSGRIVRGVRRHAPIPGTLTALEAGLESASDSLILEFSAGQRRIVVSHDFRPLRAVAEDRMRQNVPMSSLILIPQHYPAGQAINDLILIAGTTTMEEWQNKIVFLPL